VGGFFKIDGEPEEYIRELDWRMKDNGSQDGTRAFCEGNTSAPFSISERSWKSVLQFMNEKLRSKAVSEYCKTTEQHPPSANFLDPNLSDPSFVKFETLMVGRENLLS
jgi:hypothetical protein